MNLKDISRFLLAAALVVWALAPAPVFGQEEGDTETKTEEGQKGPGLLPDHEGEVSSRALYHSSFENASKFLEYRDVPQGAELQLLEFGNHRRSADDLYYRIRATDIGQKDQDLEIEMGHYGYYDLNVRWNRIPHRFGSDGITLYRGIGSGRLVLDDAIQRDLVAAGANLQRQAAVFGDHLDESQHLGIDDVDLQRDRIGGTLSWYQLDPLRVTLDVDFERRNGVRPIFGSFGFSTPAELLEPIDYQTFNVKGSIGFAKGPFDAEAFYRFGYFNSGEDSLTWDNPFRIVDTTAQAATGRMALYADNYINEFGLKAGLQLGERTRLSGTANWAIHRSEVELLPYTTNTTIRPGVAGAGNPPFDASLPGSLPDDRFDGEVFTQAYNLSLTSRPWDPFEFHLYGRYIVRNYMSETPDFVGKVRGDGSWTNFAEFEVPHSHDNSKGTIGIDTIFHMEYLRSRLKPGYSFTVERRDPEARHVTRLLENAVSLDLETEWNRWLATDVGIAYSMRDAQRYEPNTGAQFRYLRRYDVADRERYQFHLDATVTPVEWFQAAFGYQFTRDNYDANFGLERAEWQQFSINSTASPDEDVDVTLFYAYDRYDTLQAGRQWNPNSIADPYVNPLGIFEASNSNWKADIEERVHTIGFYPMWRFAPKFSVKGGYTFSYNTTRVDLSSTDSGAGATDLNPYEPWDLRAADNSDRHTVNIEFRYDHSDWLEVYAGYGYDFYRSKSDFNRRLYSVPQRVNGDFAGAYFLGLDYEDAEVHIVYLGATLRF